MKRLVAFSLTLAAALPASAAAAPARIVVLPFPVLSGKASPQTGARVASMLATELSRREGTSAEGYEAAAPSPVGAGVATPPALARAREALRKAESRFQDARAQPETSDVDTALAAYQESAPALGEAELGEVFDALALRAAQLYQLGRDDEALESLRAALRLSATRSVRPAQTSRTFARLVAAERRRLEKEPKASLRVESTPTGAALFVDGVPAGRTPVRIRQLPPGRRFWRAILASGEVVGGTVELAPDTEAALSIRSGKEDAATRALAAIAQNRLDAAARDALVELAKSKQAGLVVVGALSALEDKLALDALAVDAATGALHRLQRRQFDSALLSAGAQLLALADELLARPLSELPQASLPLALVERLPASTVRDIELAPRLLPGVLPVDASKEPGALGPDDEPRRKPLRKRP